MTEDSARSHSDLIATDVICPDGFQALVHSCFRYEDEPLSWEDARDFCQKSGAHLVTINGRKESQASFFAALKEKKSFWIGLTRKQVRTRVQTAPVGDSVAKNVQVSVLSEHHL